MDIIDVIRDEEELDLLFIQEEMNEMAQQTMISESLGKGLAVELDPDTGQVTILDSEHGVTLTALQVLTLTGFLSEHDKVFFREAWMHVEEQEG